MTRDGRVSAPSASPALFFGEFIVLSGCFLLAWFAIARGEATLYLIYDYGWIQTLLVILVVQGGLYVHLLYATVFRRPILLFLQELSVVLGVAFLFEAVVSFLDPVLILPRPVMLWGSVGALVVVPGWRYAIHTTRQAVPPQRVLLVGAGQPARELVELLHQRPRADFEIAGAVHDGPADALPLPKLGSYADLDEVVREHHPSRVVVAAPERPGPEFPTRRLMELQWAGVAVEDATALFETVAGQVTSAFLSPAGAQFPVLSGSGVAGLASPALAWMTLLLGSPLWLAALAALRLTQAGPVLERRPRLGYNGEVFQQYALREGGRDSQGRLIEPAAAKLLKRLYLYDFPMLLNVALGHMAFVGPQAVHPVLAGELVRHMPGYAWRLRVKPGMIGWADINLGRRGLPDTLQELRFDFYYIRHMRPSLDAYILLCNWWAN
jgi:lipopolysaccharide/colanic/teichoic acid biosynthesis glycosyltransferase